MEVVFRAQAAPGCASERAVVFEVHLEAVAAKAPRLFGYEDADCVKGALVSPAGAHGAPRVLAVLVRGVGGQRSEGTSGVAVMQTLPSLFTQETAVRVRVRSCAIACELAGTRGFRMPKWRPSLESPQRTTRSY